MAVATHANAAGHRPWRTGRGPFSAAPLLRVLCFGGVLLALRRLPEALRPAAYVSGVGGVAATASSQPAPAPQRRSLLLAGAAGSAAAAADVAPAWAKPSDPEVFRVPASPAQGLRSYLINKPRGFRRLASPIDPNSKIFRYINNSDYAFIVRSEAFPNASTTFTPEGFIADYQGKFTNATGSEFTLIKGGGPPNRVDKELDVSYYEVEYIITTQMGFNFDSLRSLHFLSVFAVADESIYILNCQAPAAEWEEDKDVLRKVADGFLITSAAVEVPAENKGFFSFAR